MTANNIQRQNNDSQAFIDEDANSGFKFKDLVFLVLRYLHWFVLCAAIGGVIAYYNVKGKERIYASSASMMIKTSTSGGSESFRSSSTVNTLMGQNLILSTINNEIMVLKSQSNMESMVRKLNLCTNYSYRTKLAKRNKDLYKASPIEVTFPDGDEQAWISFSVEPVNDS